MKTPYDYACFDCGYSFTKEYQFAKAPTRARCPGCNQLSSRDYSNQSVQFKGQDFYTNRRMVERSNNNKEACKKGWEALHEHTKRSVEQAQSHEFYKSPSIKWDQLIEEGKAKPLNKSESEQSTREAARHAKQCMTDGHMINVKK